MPRPKPHHVVEERLAPIFSAQACMDFVETTWAQATGDVHEIVGPLAYGSPAAAPRPWVRPPRQDKARGGPSGPRPTKTWCQPSPGDLSDYGPAASNLERRISAQKADLQEYIDAWMEKQDRLLEDLLLEALLARGSCSWAMASEAEAPPRYYPADGEYPFECEHHEPLKISTAKLWPACVLESSPSGGLGPVGRCPEAKKAEAKKAEDSIESKDRAANQDGVEGRLSAAQRKKIHHVTWNLDDETARARVLEATKRASASSEVERQPSGCHTETSEVSQASEKSQKSMMPVRSAITDVLERRRKELAGAACKVFFQRNSMPSNKSLPQARSLLEKVVKDARFEKTVGFMILMCSILVGAEVQICAVEMSNTPPLWLVVMQNIFSGVFIVELFLRLWVEGLREFVCSPEWQWNIFDAAVVFFGIVDKVSSFFYEDGSPLMVFSGLIRIVRIVRIIRVVRFLRELRLMILSIYHTLKSLLWSLVLMVLMMYLFSAYLTQATTSHLLNLDHTTPLHEDIMWYWGTLPRTAYTLFLCMSGGVSWGDPVAGLWEMHWTVVAVFLVFISFTLFAFLNVITGFFCVSATDLANTDKDQIVQEQLKNKTKYTEEFKTIFSMMDIDQSGDISLQELEDLFEDSRLTAYFSHLNLDIDKAWDIFKLLDDDGSGSVSIEEFVLGCLRLRGGAKSIDVAAIGYDVKRLKRTLSDFMYFVEGSFEDLCDHSRSGGNRRKAEYYSLDLHKDSNNGKPPKNGAQKKVKFSLNGSAGELDAQGACV